jgi:hypothetical protein
MKKDPKKLIALLVIAVFLVSTIPVAAQAASRIYTPPGLLCPGYERSDTSYSGSLSPSSPDNTLEGQINDYTKVQAADDVFEDTSYSYSHNAILVQQNYHFAISESTSDMTEIVVEWKGKVTLSSGSIDTSLFDIKTDSGTQTIASGLSGTNTLYSLDITSNFADYLDGSGELYLRIYAYDTGSSSRTLALYTDLVRVTVYIKDTTVTSIQTSTVTSTQTSTQTNTQTQTQSVTVTQSGTVTQTQSVTVTQSGTITQTDTVTQSATVTQTDTQTVTESETVTEGTQTVTETNTVTEGSETLTETQTVTAGGGGQIQVAGQAYVVIGTPLGPLRITKPAGTVSSAWIDATAASIMLGMLESPSFTYDTNSTAVNQGQNPNTGGGQPQVPAPSTIIMSGGPLVNGPVAYYENDAHTAKAENAPVYFYQYVDSGNGHTYRECRRSSDDSEILTSKADLSILGNHLDYFVIESFHDADNNQIVIVYGYTGYGTLAGALYFKTHLFPELGNTLSDGYQIVQWYDNNANGFVDPAGANGDAFIVVANQNWPST